MYIGLHVKCSLLLSDFNKIWIFLYIFQKSSNIKFQELNPVGAELFLAEGRRDMKKLIVAFRNLANVTKILHFAHSVFMCVFVYEHTATFTLRITQTDFLQPRIKVFTARYELGLEIKQFRLCL